MEHDHPSRLARAALATGPAGVDALIVGPGPDLLYLTGYDPPPLERLTALIVRPDADPVLIVPTLERPRAEEAGVDSFVRLADWRDGADPYELVWSSLPEHPHLLPVSDRLWAIHLLGIERALPGAAFMSASAVLSSLRAIKDALEVKLLRDAAVAADRAFERIVDVRFEGRRERDIADDLSALLVAEGHDVALFTIVGSGPNGASPHHEPGDRVIMAGDAVVLDFGGRRRGYSSDITRTVYVGEPTEEMRHVHAVVERAQRAAFELVKPGVAAEDVDRAARDVITAAGFGERFVHRTGHGIGLEEHEDPYLVTGNATALEVGNTFSIEPGIYLPGRFGVRIEDIVVVSPDGAATLNDSPREPIVVA